MRILRGDSRDEIHPVTFRAHVEYFIVSYLRTLEKLHPYRSRARPSLHIAAMFAALANDDAYDDDSDDDEITARASLSSSISESDSESTFSAADVDRDLWRWSTEATASAATRASKPTKLLQGEKKRLKALHCADVRARRAQRDGFLASDARMRMESVARTGRALTIVLSSRGFVAAKQGKLIRACARALAVDAREGRRGKRVVVDVDVVHGVSRVPERGEDAYDELERACAPPMTRAEYLMSDERRARRAKAKAGEAREAAAKKKKKSRGRNWNKTNDDSRGGARERGARVEVEFQRARERMDEFEDERTTETPNATARVVSAEFGEFERHTLGYGSKILAKMGFTAPGQGLGASSQGVAEAPTAEARAKRAGLGATPL